MAVCEDIDCDKQLVVIMKTLWWEHSGKNKAIARSVSHRLCHFSHSVKLDNSAEWNIPLSSDPLQPFSMAYDWLGGHFFITERRGFELKMAVVNGPGRGTIVNLVNNRLPKPGQVFMDSRNR